MGRLMDCKDATVRLKIGNDTVNKQIDLWVGGDVRRPRHGPGSMIETFRARKSFCTKDGKQEHGSVRVCDGYGVLVCIQRCVCEVLRASSSVRHSFHPCAWHKRRSAPYLKSVSNTVNDMWYVMMGTDCSQLYGEEAKKWKPRGNESCSMG